MVQMKVTTSLQYLLPSYILAVSSAKKTHHLYGRQTEFLFYYYFDLPLFTFSSQKCVLQPSKSPIYHLPFCCRIRQNSLVHVISFHIVSTHSINVSFS
jgi:hypothetical protein